ncbi:MAG: hypothetical protein WCT41_02955 [Candidatus Paceibacterota bacterium]|jgi:hypothetical protein
MDKLLVIVRHGEYSGGDSSPLSEDGRKQMENLRTVVNAFVTKTFGDSETIRVCFSFSALPRALESIRALRCTGEDMIVTNLYMTDRDEIRKPHEILDKVLRLADHYNANVIIVVAHGEMPSVVAETAHEFVTREKISGSLPYVGKDRGFIVNMSTGEITHIGHDSLDEKKKPAPVVQETTRPVIRGGPPRTDRPVIRGGPKRIPESSQGNDYNDDIPF